MKRGLAVLLLIGATAPAASAGAPPRHLFVIGDSLAYDHSAHLRRELPRWTIEEDFSFARSARETAHDLRVRARAEAVAHDVRACRWSMKPPALIPGPLPAGA